MRRELLVALLDHAGVAAQGAGVAGLDLDQHLVQEPAPVLRPGLDQVEVIGPEKCDPEEAGQVDGSARLAVHFDPPPGTLPVDQDRDAHLGPLRSALHQRP